MVEVKNAQMYPYQVDFEKLFNNAVTRLQIEALKKENEQLRTMVVNSNESKALEAVRDLAVVVRDLAAEFKDFKATLMGLPTIKKEMGQMEE